MKQQRERFYRPSKTLHDAQIELARQIASEGAEILRQNPTPDYFLGRKTREPFPKEEELDQQQRSSRLLS